MTREERNLGNLHAGKKIAEGANGVVYIATHKQLGEKRGAVSIALALYQTDLFYFSYAVSENDLWQYRVSLIFTKTVVLQRKRSVYSHVKLS